MTKTKQIIITIIFALVVGLLASMFVDLYDQITNLRAQCRNNKNLIVKHEMMINGPFMAQYARPKRPANLKPKGWR